MRIESPKDVDFSAGIYFRHMDLEPTQWGAHSHLWGQWNYVSHGVMDLTVNGTSFRSPPQYAIWIPPNLPHSSRNARKALYRTAYLSLHVSRRLPDYPCAMSVSPVLKAILEEFSRLDVRVPTTAAHRRMAAVAIDQISIANQIADYLPAAVSPQLHVILEYLERDLGRKHSTTELANKFHITARTLERRCMRELGLGIGEWQQRLRFLRAIDGLEQGQSVKEIALSLGYASPSSFITMFRAIAGQTPDQFRRTAKEQ